MGWLLGLVALLLVAGPALAAKDRKSEDLFNPLLGIDYSHWLVGPVHRIATDEEITAYLELTSDEAARQFIDAFWAKRNQGTDYFQKTPQEVFQQRAETADKRFSEAAYPGRRTDRGMIYILYGEPESITYETPRDVRDPSPELWTYGKDAPPGLDGKAPEKAYRFFKVDDLTVFYTEGVRAKARQQNRRQLRPHRF